jgi:hypothetical protein
MAKSANLQDDFNAEKKMSEYNENLAKIDERIKEYKWQIALLGEERRKTLEKMHNIDMDIVLQCITDKGLSSKEVLTLINDYAHLL